MNKIDETTYKESKEKYNELYNNFWDKASKIIEKAKVKGGNKAMWAELQVNNLFTEYFIASGMFTHLHNIVLYHAQNQEFIQEIHSNQQYDMLYMNMDGYGIGDKQKSKRQKHEEKRRRKMLTCTHFDKNGKDAVKRNDDGSMDCPICGRHWEAMKPSSDSDVRNIKKVIETMQTVKWLAGGGSLKMLKSTRILED